MKGEDYKDKTIAELGELNRKLLNREAELKRREYYLEVYNKIVSTLIRSTELKPALLDTLHLICEGTKSEMGVMYLFDRERNLLIPFSGISCREDLPSFKMGEGIIGICAKERKTLTFTDFSEKTYFKIFYGKGKEKVPGMVVLTPLLKKEELFGVLLVGKNGSYLPEDKKLLERISIQLTIFIDNSLKFKKIFDLARELKVRTGELQRKYVELEKLYYDKSKLFASISHEFKTPLNSIIGFSKILLKESYGKLNSKQKEFVGYIHKNGNILLEFVEDLLSIARIERGVEKIEMVDINLKNLIEESARHLKPLLNKKNLELEISIDERLKDVKGDVKKVRQVLFNLLSNAIKFSKEGEKIEVGAYPSEYGDEVKIFVRDRGMGIPEEELPKIFEPFYKGKVSGGTGLGLYISKRFVELHKGRIWVESREGEGSTFFFTLPLKNELKGGPKIVKMRF